MATVKMVEYADATPEVREVFDDIMATRNVNYVTPYWRTIAHHPPTLRDMWSMFKRTMASGALDALTKEMLYLAVSVTNRCEYCIEAHTRAARGMGMSEEMLGELMAVVTLAGGANQLAVGYQIAIDRKPGD